MTEAYEKDFAASRDTSARRERARDALLACIVAAGLASAFFVSRQLDARRPAQDPFASYEELYVRPETARRMSLSFNGLVADWYWEQDAEFRFTVVSSRRSEKGEADPFPLVGHKHCRIIRKSACDSHTLLLTAREFAW